MPGGEAASAHEEPSVRCGKRRVSAVFFSARVGGRENALTMMRKGRNTPLERAMLPHGLRSPRCCMTAIVLTALLSIALAFRFSSTKKKLHAGFSRVLDEQRVFLRDSGTWAGIAEVGPAESPSAWQSSQPVNLFMTYRGWPGVYAAARAQGPVLGTLLQFELGAAQRLVDLIARTPSVQNVVIHGIPPGTIGFARILKERLPRVRILFVYHGTSAAPFHENESGLVSELIDLARARIVDAVGAVKVGFASTFSSLGVPNVFTVPNFPSISPILPSKKYSTIDGRVHVGILTSSKDFHKNVATQVVAACAIPNVVVHVTFRPNIAYLKNCSLVETGYLAHGLFLEEAARMDVLMYVSLTECYPMLVLEAITLGIPVVVSRTHHMLDLDAVLAKALTVDEADNPENIKYILTGAIARSAELRPQLRALAACLQRHAEVTWAAVLQVPSAVTTNPSVGRPLALPSPSCPPAATAELSSMFPQLPRGATPFMRIAFITYELSPGTPGGAGVLISSLAETFLARGHSVTILAHTDANAIATWTQHMIERGWKVGPREQLTVHSVPVLVSEEELFASSCSPQNIFYRRASVFAVAAQLAYKAAPFDAIEVFDYVGAAFELLRRLVFWRRATGKGGTAPPPYLPPHVPIFVRLHGSLQLIHQAEGAVLDEERPQPCAASDDERPAWPLMYLMERYSLMTAHVLLAQSVSMSRVYSDAYGLDESRILIAPPPMAHILADIIRGHDSSSTAIHAAPSSSQLRLLVYGRVARMKGAETIAAAAGIIQAGLPPGMVLHLSFVGIDWECPVHRRLTSDCVRALLPSGISTSFDPPIDRVGLSALASTMHGAIIASEFETYGLTAHELAATGLPLIISDIPAFRDFFTERNAYVFRAGDAESLALATVDLARDFSSGGAPRSARIEYADAIEPYLRAILVARATPSGMPPVSLDTHLVEAAIAAVEGSCWNNAECRRTGLKARPF